MDPQPNDLIISAIEINNRHGVGILLQRFFPNSSNLITLRSLSVYNGEESFGIGHHELKSGTLTVPEIETRLKKLLSQYQIRRILCVPYYREDFIHGILAKKLTGAPLCTYLMDDQNVFTSQVPDYWVDGLLRVSEIRFGISPELCAAYQHKYGVNFHLLPPLVERAEPLVPCYWQPDPEAPFKVAMIGNVWTAKRFLQLRELLQATGLHVDWYGSGSAASWLPGTPEEWESDNIRCFGYLPEQDLVAALAAYPCVLVPSGSLDQNDDNISFSRLSLPSRLVFLHTRTDTPVLLLGSEDSSAGRFIRGLGTGLCAGYEVSDLRIQIARMQDPAEHRSLRQAIRHWAPSLVLPDGGEWLWESLSRQTPSPATFHSAFQTKHDNTSWLRTVRAATGKPVRPVPAKEASLTDEAVKAFAFLRTSHLPLVQAKEATPPPAGDIEVTHFLEQTLGYLTEKLLSDGGKLLVLGTTIPSWAAGLPTNITGWRIRDVEEWQQTGFSSETTHLVSLTGADSFPEASAEFDAIVSSNWLDYVKTSEARTDLAGYLTRHTRPGGLNLHGVTAVLHPDYFWTTPTYAYLRASWKLEDWPGLDDILTTSDLFVMTEEAYSKFWQPNIGRSYQDFGQPIGLFLFWRKN